MAGVSGGALGLATKNALEREPLVAGHDKVREPANRVRRHELIFEDRKDWKYLIDNKKKREK